MSWSDKLARLEAMIAAGSATTHGASTAVSGGSTFNVAPDGVAPRLPPALGGADVVGGRPTWRSASWSGLPQVASVPVVGSRRSSLDSGSAGVHNAPPLDVTSLLRAASAFVAAAPPPPPPPPATSSQVEGVESSGVEKKEDAQGAGAAARASTEDSTDTALPPTDSNSSNSSSSSSAPATSHDVGMIRGVAMNSNAPSQTHTSPSAVPSSCGPPPPRPPPPPPLATMPAAARSVPVHAPRPPAVSANESNSVASLLARAPSSAEPSAARPPALPAPACGASAPAPSPSSSLQAPSASPSTSVDAGLLQSLVIAPAPAHSTQVSSHAPPPPPPPPPSFAPNTKALAILPASAPVLLALPVHTPVTESACDADCGIALHVVPHDVDASPSSTSGQEAGNMSLSLSEVAKNLATAMNTTSPALAPVLPTADVPRHALGNEQSGAGALDAMLEVIPVSVVDAPLPSTHVAVPSANPSPCSQDNSACAPQLPLTLSVPGAAVGSAFSVPSAVIAAVTAPPPPASSTPAMTSAPQTQGRRSSLLGTGRRRQSSGASLGEVGLDTAETTSSAENGELLTGAVAQAMAKAIAQAITQVDAYKTEVERLRAAAVVQEARLAQASVPLPTSDGSPDRTSVGDVHDDATNGVGVAASAHTHVAQSVGSGAVTVGFGPRALELLSLVGWQGGTSSKDAAAPALVQRILSCAGAAALKAAETAPACDVGGQDSSDMDEEDAHTSAAEQAQRLLTRGSTSAALLQPFSKHLVVAVAAAYAGAPEALCAEMLRVAAVARRLVDDVQQTREEAARRQANQTEIIRILKEQLLAADAAPLSSASYPDVSARKVVRGREVSNLPASRLRQPSTVPKSADDQLHNTSPLMHSNGNMSEGEVYTPPHMRRLQHEFDRQASARAVSAPRVLQREPARKPQWVSSTIAQPRDKAAQAQERAARQRAVAAAAAAALSQANARRSANAGGSGGAPSTSRSAASVLSPVAAVARRPPSTTTASGNNVQQVSARQRSQSAWPQSRVGGVSAAGSSHSDGRSVTSTAASVRSRMTANIALTQRTRGSVAQPLQRTERAVPSSSSNSDAGFGALRGIDVHVRAGMAGVSAGSAYAVASSRPAPPPPTTATATAKQRLRQHVEAQAAAAPSLAQRLLAKKGVRPSFTTAAQPDASLSMAAPGAAPNIGAHTPTMVISPIASRAASHTPHILHSPPPPQARARAPLPPAASVLLPSLAGNPDLSSALQRIALSVASVQHRSGPSVQPGFAA